METILAASIEQENTTYTTEIPTSDNTIIIPLPEDNKIHTQGEEIYEDRYQEPVVSDFFDSDPIFTSEYTQDYQQPDIYENDANIFVDDASVELKNDIKSLINQVKDPLKLKAYEMGFIDDEELMNQSSEDQAITLDERINNISQNNQQQTTPNWNNQHKPQKSSEQDTYYDDQLAEAFYKKIKIGVIILFVLYLLYKGMSFIMRRS